MNIIKKTMLIFIGLILTANASKALSPIVLSGETGGVANANEWKSESLKGKVNLLLYTTPSKQKWVKPLLDRLESSAYETEKLGVIFVINLDVFGMLKGVVRKKLKKRANSDKRKIYVIDNKKVLVDKWKLEDGNATVMLLDPSGKIVFTNTGEITEDIVKEIFEKIKNLTEEF